MYRESYTNNLIQTNQHFLYSFPVQVWDEGLETIARNYAEKCDFNHNKLRSTSVGYYVGENLYVSYGMYTYTGEHVCVYKQMWNSITHKPSQLTAWCLCIPMVFQLIWYFDYFFKITSQIFFFIIQINTMKQSTSLKCTTCKFIDT